MTSCKGQCTLCYAQAHLQATLVLTSSSLDIAVHSLATVGCLHGLWSTLDQVCLHSSLGFLPSSLPKLNFAVASIQVSSEQHSLEHLLCAMCKS